MITSFTDLRPAELSHTERLPGTPAPFRRRASWPLAAPELHALCASERLKKGVVSGATMDLLHYLPPRPLWRPLPQDNELTAPPLVDVASQSPEVGSHLSEIVARAQSLMPSAQRSSAVQWLKVRDQVKVGVADVVLPEPSPAGGVSTRVVLKQIGPQNEGPSRTFLQERAWLEGLPPQTQCPRLLAACEKTSLLVMQHIPGDMIPPTWFHQARRTWVARALATVHAAPLSAEMLAIRGERRFPWSIEAWLPFVQRLKLVSQPTYDNLFALRDCIVAELDALPAVRKAIHGDPMPGNILVDDSKQRVILIDYEYAAKGDPMFDLAFFAVSIHLPFSESLALLAPYHDTQSKMNVEVEPSDPQRLALYVLYQRLFRHVASHKEYAPGRDNQYDRWLSRLVDDVDSAQAAGWLRAPRQASHHTREL